MNRFLYATNRFVMLCIIVLTITITIGAQYTTYDISNYFAIIVSLLIGVLISSPVWLIIVGVLWVILNIM